jgi:23S rRNA (pseudouridine1915-N3)-methyltransferase
MFSKVVFLHFGKFKSKEHSSIFDDYLGRLKHYIKTEVKELKVERDDPEYFKKIQDKVEDSLKGTVIMAFSERGKLSTSLELSNFIEAGSGILSVVVGTSWGLPDYVEKKASYVLALGRLTLPHEAVRVIACEQLYRACTIIKNENYHK